MAREALDHAPRRLLVAEHQLAPVLGVHACGKARGVHEVAKEHGELAALTKGAGCWGAGRNRHPTPYTPPLHFSAALAAELDPRSVRESAARALGLQRCAALAAKLYAAR